MSDGATFDRGGEDDPMHTATFDRGGWLPSGLTAVVNATGAALPVESVDQDDDDGNASA